MTYYLLCKMYGYKRSPKPNSKMSYIINFLNKIEKNHYITFYTKNIRKFFHIGFFHFQFSRKFSYQQEIIIFSIIIIFNSLYKYVKIFFS